MGEALSLHRDGSLARARNGTLVHDARQIEYWRRLWSYLLHADAT